MEEAFPTVPGYDVLAPLGAGASATVWRARREADARLLAVKVVEVADGDMSAALREAAVLSRVRHEHLVHLYDVLPLPGRDGQPARVALAMQLAEGGSLADVLAGRGHLSPGELVTVVAPLAGALADLHRAAVVHGDVSPGNVLFLADGMPVLADLGVCRVAGLSPGAVHGTDGMVAPEVLEGFPPSAESDVYALGAVAWTCLVGEPPGWVGTRGDLADLAPDVPAALREVVLACLAPEPVDRPEAEEAAVRFFEAATPEPVELAPGADPAAGLTRRIRLEASADVLAEPAETAGVPGHRAAARSGAARFAGTGAAWRRRGRRVLLVSVAVAVLVPACVLGARWVAGWVLAPGEAVVTSEGTPLPDDSLATVGPVATSGPVPDASITAPGPSLPEQDVTRALQELLDARAAAWRRGDVERLEAAHVPESAAWVQDRADLEAAAGQGVGYRDLAFTAEDVELVESGEDVLVVTARVERAAYTVVADDGAEEHPRSAEEVTFELRKTAQGWRIWSWSS